MGNRVLLLIPSIPGPNKYVKRTDYTVCRVTKASDHPTEGCTTNIQKEN